MVYNLGHKFNQISTRNSNKFAINFDNKSYTYSDLNNKSAYFVNILYNLGFKKGDVLCIVNTKQFDAYAMMIACLKTGVTYVNLDEDNPIHRIEKILLRCHPKGLFEDSESNNFKIISDKNSVIHFNTKSDQKITSNIHKQLFDDVDGNTIAYIMFTSGSTGEPKGVAITHQNLLHFIDWIALRYAITDKDNFANLSPMYFDNSVFDFYGALFNGATLTPISKQQMDDPKGLVEYVDKMKCTIWFSVPSLLIFLLNMKVLSKDILIAIRIFTFGGEGFPKSNLIKLYNIYNQTAKLINVYGPTEGTCICSSYDISETVFSDMSELPSLGKMNPNFSYQIEKSEINDANVGELIIIGPNIAAGYYNFKEKTEEVFGVFQSGKYYLNRYYRTGDLVEEKEDLLYFKGRIDNQIKHMGYRIELEEIENALDTIDTIIESAVIYKRINDSYGKIIAYVVSNGEEEGRKIKAVLKNLIPQYMIPSKIEFMTVLPKNANGKIDRKQLKFI